MARALTRRHLVSGRQLMIKLLVAELCLQAISSQLRGKVIEYPQEREADVHMFGLLTYRCSRIV